jgi:membrane protease YdiL (CAAX protease family)
MNPTISTLHIIIAILFYLAVAVLTMLIVKKFGGNLKNTSDRISTTTLLAGAAANLLVLAIILILLKLVDHLPFQALGLGLSGRDGLFSLVAVSSMVLLAVSFVRWQRHDREQDESGKSKLKLTTLPQTLIGFLVLLIVVVQEEVLYRGYITLNLKFLSPAMILIITTIIFVLIHFLTNRVGIYQVISWTVSGLLLAGTYLASGSIWVPIFLHLATDLINVLIFNITGQFSSEAIRMIVTAKDRAIFRVIYGVVISLALFAFYLPL